MNSEYLNYLKDSIPLLVEQALETKREQSSSNSDFDNGKLMAYYEVITLLQQQAVAFGVPLSDIGLDKISPDNDLL